MMTTRSGLLPAIILLLALAGTAAADETPARPDLSGQWVLNQQASDNLMEVLGPAAAGRGGGGGGGGGRGGGGHGGVGQSDMSQEDRSAQIQRRMERILERLNTLEIFHEDPDLDYTDGLEISRLLHTDGRTDTVWTDQGQMKATAAWNGSTLEITWRGERGSRKTYLSLSADGDQLIANEQLTSHGGGPGATIRLVYDRAGSRTE